MVTRAASGACVALPWGSLPLQWPESAVRLGALRTPGGIIPPSVQTTQTSPQGRPVSFFPRGRGDCAELGDASGGVSACLRQVAQPPFGGQGARLPVPTFVVPLGPPSHSLLLLVPMPGQSSFSLHCPSWGPAPPAGPAHPSFSGPPDVRGSRLPASAGGAQSQPGGRWRDGEGPPPGSEVRHVNGPAKRRVRDTSPAILSGPAETLLASLGQRRLSPGWASKPVCEPQVSPLAQGKGEVPGATRHT